MSNLSGRQLVAVLRRAIPVEGYAVDTCTYMVGSGETVERVFEWAAATCKPSCTMVSLEITLAEQYQPKAVMDARG